MIVYKRNAWSLFKSIVLSIFGSFALSVIVWIVCSILSVNSSLSFIITLVVGVLVLIAMTYSAIFSENIRFEISPDGYFKYIKRDKVVNEYYLPECGIGYRTVTGKYTNTDLKLEIKTPNGESEYIDCSPLGMSKFTKMVENIRTIQGTIDN